MLSSSALSRQPLKTDLSPDTGTTAQALQPVSSTQVNLVAHQPQQSNFEHPALVSSTYTTVTCMQLPEEPPEPDEFAAISSTSSTSSATSTSSTSSISSNLTTTQAKVAVVGTLHRFDEIRIESEPTFDLLRRVESNLCLGYVMERPKAKSDVAIGKNLADFKKIRDKTDEDAITDIAKTAPYKALSKHRFVSILENLLPTESKCRALLDPYTGGIRDVSTGLYVELHKAVDSNAYVLCFPGSGAGDMNTKQWKTNLKQLSGAGGVPKAYTQAAELVPEIRAAMLENGKEEWPLELAGHSLGGGIANYVGMKRNLKSTCFNAAALGPACLRDLSDVMTEERISKQTHIRIKGDVISSTKSQKRLASILPGFDKDDALVPTHVGVVYLAGPDMANYPQGSIMDRHRLDGFINLYKKPHPVESDTTT